MKVRILGCSGGIGGRHLRTTSILVDSDILIDCGTGVADLSIAELAQIDHVFLKETGIEMNSLEDLLGRSDFVSLNCDLNPTSRHLMNARTLACMRPTGVLINTARGPIIDEPALVSALQAGEIAGAALDVYEHEPLPHTSPLCQMDNVMLTPHNANSSPAAWERVHLNTIKNLLDGLGI